MRLNITVEGQTEEVFVRDTIAPYLGRHGVYAVARSVLTGSGVSPFNGTSRYQFRGGLRRYQSARDDITLWMREDRRSDVRFTTMFDLYALPGDWPGLAAERRGCDVYDHVRQIETAFGDDIGDRRFIPYVQVHEFEALLLADPEAFFVRHPAAEGIAVLRAAVAEAHGNPEMVDDGPDTHPSARIRSAIRTYSKTTDGPRIAAEIGIERMRNACPHFDEWVAKLVALGA